MVSVYFDIFGFVSLYYFLNNNFRLVSLAILNLRINFKRGPSFSTLCLIALILFKIYTCYTTYCILIVPFLFLVHGGCNSQIKNV